MPHDRRNPGVRQRYGGWEYDPEHLTLTFTRYGYCIDLETITTSAEMLDWIFQLHGKGWGQEEMPGLLEAFDDLFHPQATLCSGGNELGPIDTAALLARRPRL